MRAPDIPGDGDGDPPTLPRRRTARTAAATAAIRTAEPGGSAAMAAPVGESPGPAVTPTSPVGLGA